MSWSLWIMTAIMLLVIEILTPGAFFFACLSIGAFFAGLTTLWTVQGWVSWIVFITVSIMSIYTIRPFAKRLFHLNPRKSNVDALLGQKAYVTQEINPPNLGMVKVEGEIWRAEASEKIEAGAYVEVIKVIGTRLEVKKASE